MAFQAQLASPVGVQPDSGLGCDSVPHEVAHSGSQKKILASVTSTHCLQERLKCSQEAHVDIGLYG
ncbi:hypothetical protein DSO57_1022738 [Entomophthora muscae]|uniref:Uncharacterized protein n=1 Tax=Entomophthora muscae TaxID=34485 RepID=A0ACC2RU89_9FUNG|nr:hypothetical protein DSO57_1022738 [Entomophthora muscae]